MALLYAVLFVVNTGEIVFRAAESGDAAAWCRGTVLERANGWLGGGTTLMHEHARRPARRIPVRARRRRCPFLVNAARTRSARYWSALIGGDLPGRRRRRRTHGGPLGARRRSAEGFRWLAGQRLLRTMAVLIGLLNLTLTAAMAVLVLLAASGSASDSVGYGLLFTCMAVGGLLGAVVGDRLIARVTPTWTVRVGLLVEAGLHLALAASPAPRGRVRAVRLRCARRAVEDRVELAAPAAHPAEAAGPGRRTNLFIAAGGNCVGALLGGVVAGPFGITAPYWVGLVVAVGVLRRHLAGLRPRRCRRAYADPTPVE